MADPRVTVWVVDWETLEEGGWVDDMGTIRVEAATESEARALIHAEARRLGLVGPAAHCRMSVPQREF